MHLRSQQSFQKNNSGNPHTVQMVASVQLDVRDPRLHELIDPNGAIETVASGFDFTEGPIWHPKEQSLIFSDILGNSLYR